MLVRELLEKIDKENSGLDFIQISHTDNSGCFNINVFEGKNLEMLEKYLDKEVKSIKFNTFEEYDEDWDRNSYVSYVGKYITIEVEHE